MCTHKRQLLFRLAMRYAIAVSDTINVKRYIVNMYYRNAASLLRVIYPTRPLHRLQHGRQFIFTPAYIIILYL